MAQQISPRARACSSAWTSRGIVLAGYRIQLAQRPRYRLVLSPWELRGPATGLDRYESISTSEAAPGPPAVLHAFFQAGLIQVLFGPTPLPRENPFPRTLEQRPYVVPWLPRTVPRPGRSATRSSQAVCLPRDQGGPGPEGMPRGGKASRANLGSSGTSTSSSALSWW